MVGWLHAPTYFFTSSYHPRRKRSLPVNLQSTCALGRNSAEGAPRQDHFIQLNILLVVILLLFSFLASLSYSFFSVQFSEWDKDGWTSLTNSWTITRRTSTEFLFVSNRNFSSLLLLLLVVNSLGLRGNFIIMFLTQPHAAHATSNLVEQFYHCQVVITLNRHQYSQSGSVQHSPARFHSWRRRRRMKNEDETFDESSGKALFHFFFSCKFLFYLEVLLYLLPTSLSR